MFACEFYLSLDDPPFLATLARGATLYLKGKRYRDLSKLNRKPSRVLYVSAHALENCLQPENCVVIKPWKKGADDTTLADLAQFLEDIAAAGFEDVRPTLSHFAGKDVAAEYNRRRCMMKNKEKPTK